MAPKALQSYFSIGSFVFPSFCFFRVSNLKSETDRKAVFFTRKSLSLPIFKLKGTFNKGEIKLKL